MSFFLPTIWCGTGTTGKYRRIASTAALAEPPSPYRRIHSWEARLNTKTIDPSSRSALVSASSPELLKKYYVKKAKSKTFADEAPNKKVDLKISASEERDATDEVSSTNVAASRRSREVRSG
eukprot:SAG11_NODE_1896_length_4091_cov_48.963176_1_plen_122_part_00